jgi:hypothetical protein
VMRLLGVSHRREAGLRQHRNVGNTSAATIGGSPRLSNRDESDRDNIVFTAFVAGSRGSAIGRWGLVSTSRRVRCRPATVRPHHDGVAPGQLISSASPAHE